MELYRPNGKISAALQLKGDINRDIFHGCYIFNTFSGESEIMKHVELCYERINTYYRVRVLDIPSNLFVRFGHVALEMLVDSVKHGVPPINYNLFITKEGVCQGFKDQGDFYKRKDIKEKVESRTPLEKITRKNMGSDSGRGLAYVYVMSNEIEVDTTNGILWTAHLR